MVCPVIVRGTLSGPRQDGEFLRIIAAEPFVVERGIFLASVCHIGVGDEQ